MGEKSPNDLEKYVVVGQKKRGAEAGNYAGWEINTHSNGAWGWAFSDGMNSLSYDATPCDNPLQMEGGIRLGSPFVPRKKRLVCILTGLMWLFIH